MADALTLALMPRFVMHRWCSSMTKPAKRLWGKGAPSLKRSAIAALANISDVRVIVGPT